MPIGDDRHGGAAHVERFASSFLSRLVPRQREPAALAVAGFQIVDPDRRELADPQRAIAAEPREGSIRQTCQSPLGGRECGRRSQLRSDRDRTAIRHRSSAWSSADRPEGFTDTSALREACGVGAR